MMEPQEFNEHIERLANGRPITIVVNRLLLALVSVMNGDAAAEERFRAYVREQE